MLQGGALVILQMEDASSYFSEDLGRLRQEPRFLRASVEHLSR